MLGTLDDLKGKLDIPASDTSRDDTLTLALETASAKVLDLCRYTEDDTTGIEDVFRNVQFNRELTLGFRPVTNVVFEGRALGATDWSTLDGDVLDADAGTVILLGASSWWPPTRTLRPKSQKWRDPEWPIIRVTYDVTGLGADPASELVDAACSLAAYWYDRDLAGAKDNATIGPVKVQWLNEALPATLLEKLTKHLRKGQGSARWV